jgi:hypothetical protein
MTMMPRRQEAQKTDKLEERCSQLRASYPLLNREMARPNDDAKETANA